MLAGALLAACSEARTSGEAQAAAPPELLGQFSAASEAAHAIGDVGVERAGLIFANGAVLYTRTLEPRSGHDRISRDGASYAALAGGDVVQVQLRRVVDFSAAEALCDGRAPSFVALAQAPRAAGFTMLIFTGEDPPSANAQAISVCARYAYLPVQAASAGVVLW